MAYSFLLYRPRGGAHWISSVGWVEERNPTKTIGVASIHKRPIIDMRYRRSQVKGGSFFFTVVTFKRMKILMKPSNVDLLRESFKHVIQSHPFTIDAFVLLPDHLHCIWTLPEDDSDFSTRWRLIKTRFARRCDDRLKHEALESRKRKNEQNGLAKTFLGTSNT